MGSAGWFLVDPTSLGELFWCYWTGFCMKQCGTSCTKQNLLLYAPSGRTRGQDKRHAVSVPLSLRGARPALGEAI